MLSVKKKMQKCIAIMMLTVMTVAMIAAATPIIRAIPEIRIMDDPFAVEIPTPWELDANCELSKLAEAEVPEWYRGHGNLTLAEAKALAEYKENYPEMELGENPVPCTVNGVKGIVYETAGHVYIVYGPVTKQIG